MSKEARIQRQFNRTQRDIGDSVVYVTQIPARRDGDAWVPIVNLTPVGEYGEINTLLPSGMNYPEAGSILAQIVPKLEAFRPDRDYLLPLGDPMVMAAAAAVLGARHSTFRLLKWDRIHKRYFVFTFQLAARKENQNEQQISRKHGDEG